MNVWMNQNLSHVAKVVALAAALTLAACGGESGENNDENNGGNNSTNNSTNNDTNNSTNNETNNATNNATNNDTNNATNNDTNNDTNNATNNDGGEFAALQVLHLSNDANAGVVDVYLNGDLLLDDFAYKEGTNFFPAPVGVELEIAITPGDSEEAVATFTLPDDLLEADTNYVAVATGSLELADAGTDKEFTLALIPDVATAADDDGLIQLEVFHGALDAPAVDLVLDNDTQNPVIDGFTYKQSASAAIDPDGFTLGTIGLIDIYVDDADDQGNEIFFTGLQTGDLTGLAGGAAVVAAAGSLAGGDFEIVAFPAAVGEAPEKAAGIALGTPSARLQVIHNSPDPAASTVDVYTDAVDPAVLLIDDFDFQYSTPYISVPAGIDLKLDITGGDAADNSQPVANDIPVTLDPSSVTVAIAAGLVNDDPVTGFQLLAVGGKETSKVGDEATEALIVHGIPDAPEVGIGAEGQSVVGGATLSYPQTTGAYVELPATANLTLQLLDATNTSALFGTTIDVPLTAVANTPVVVLASGQLSTEAGLLIVTPGGTGDEPLVAPLAPIPN